MKTDKSRSVEHAPVQRKRSAPTVLCRRGRTGLVVDPGSTSTRRRSARRSIDADD
jgi:hypothetical protein